MSEELTARARTRGQSLMKGDVWCREWFLSTGSSCCSTFSTAGGSESISLHMMTATLWVPRAVSVAAPAWLTAVGWGGERRGALRATGPIPGAGGGADQQAGNHLPWEFADQHEQGPAQAFESRLGFDGRQAVVDHVHDLSHLEGDTGENGMAAEQSPAANPAAACRPSVMPVPGLEQSPEGWSLGSSRFPPPVEGSEPLL